MTTISPATTNTQPNLLDSSLVSKVYITSLICSGALKISCICWPTFNYITNIVAITSRAISPPSFYYRVADLSLLGIWAFNPLLAAQVSHIASGALNVNKGLNEMYNGNTREASKNILKGTGKFLFAAVLMTANPQIIVISTVALAIIDTYVYFCEQKPHSFPSKYDCMVVPHTILHSVMMYLQIPMCESMHDVDWERFNTAMKAKTVSECLQALSFKNENS